MSEPSPHASFWFAGSRVTIRIAQAWSRDGLSLLEHQMPCGFSPPWHVHRDEDESFYVLEGAFRFVAGDEEHRLQAGESLLIPRGVPHSFKVVSGDGGRFLTMTSDGFENAVREAGQPFVAGSEPTGAPTPAEQKTLFDACARHGIDIVGPPLD